MWNMWGRMSTHSGPHLPFSQSITTQNFYSFTIPYSPKIRIRFKIKSSFYKQHLEKTKHNLCVKMAAETIGMCLLRGMDCLWFYHTILFSKNTLYLFPETPKLSLPTSESPNYSSKGCSQISVESEHDFSPVASITTGSQDETSSQESDHYKKYTKHENRATRLNLVSSKTRYHHSSSPLTSARRKSGHGHYSAMRLQKTRSCKSLGELELEEVKGFMDLGFNFKKEKLSKHLMRLIPGLQRIDNTDNDEDEEKKGVMRPYLSEAWFVNRPDNYSPLMNLRVARVSSNEDMKKHLKSWARTVALAIQQDS
ncbi:hypothetical protein PHJA_001058500 [Phtheirospermum japonicum]|uniref:Uncharacterized protein n=1 Tax=Phtheirospermum japonicum TaxID=374723 RepID=A0A830BW15_9LAMI|nr:hypothetical protein PHJA_001058500 [Phtheirospermum japonicum]